MNKHKWGKRFERVKFSNYWKKLGCNDYTIYIGDDGLFIDCKGDQQYAVFTPEGEDLGYLKYQEIAHNPKEYAEILGKTVKYDGDGKKYPMKLFRWES